MRVVIAADCAPLAWANGGGVTRDLALESAAAGAVSAVSDGPAFDWRLSLADIDRDGPFSTLPCVDRVFAVVEGALVLGFAEHGAGRGGRAARCDANASDDASSSRGGCPSPDAAPRADASSPAGPIACDAACEPLAFPGEAAPGAALSDGARCRALNLMLARGRRTGAMRRVVLADGTAPGDAWSRGATRGGASVRACWVQRGRVVAGGRVIGAGALLVLDAGDPEPLALGEAVLLEVAIGPPGPPGSSGAPGAPGAPGPPGASDPSDRGLRSATRARAATRSPSRSRSAADQRGVPMADDPRTPR